METKEGNGSADKDEEKGLPPNTSELLQTEDERSKKENESLVALTEDLTALLNGSVKCEKRKPPSSKETRKEAFDRYMKIIYRLPQRIKIDLEDTFDPDKLYFYHESCDREPCNRPALKEEVRLNSNVKVPVNVEKKKKKASLSNSMPKTLMKVKPSSVDVPAKCVTVDKDEALPKTASPVEQPKRKTPTPLSPPQHPRTPTPLTEEEPTPEAPAFIRQFADASWFKDLYPDEESITSSLSPEDFSLQLLACLNTCSAPSKIKVLAALQALHSQGLLQSTDDLHQGLSDLVPKFIKPNMAPVDRTVLVEMLNLLTDLKSANCDFVKKLLALLAFKQLGVQDAVLHIMTTLGVHEAELWLWPELESWDSQLQDLSSFWDSLSVRADWWLDSWIAKYKDHVRDIRSTANWNPTTFSMVDVLNHFCSVQKDEYRRAQCVGPPGRQNAVLLPLCDCSQPILRLGETYSMARIFRPPGLILPPLRNRPFLTRFPKFISMPLPRVTLCPFHIHSEEDWVKFSPHRYFILQQSYVDYYR